MEGKEKEEDEMAKGSETTNSHFWLRHCFIRRKDNLLSTVGLQFTWFSIFTGLQHSLLSRSAVSAIAKTSVRLSVWTAVFCQIKTMKSSLSAHAKYKPSPRNRSFIFPVLHFQRTRICDFGTNKLFVRLP